MARNPYDFVPLENAATFLDAKPSQLSTMGYSGIIDFELHVLTPLCVHQDPSQPGPGDVYRFARLVNTATLPATSLKGMLRSVHEALTNSTIGVLKYTPPPTYLSSRDGSQLTASEALFGMVGGEGSESVGYAGRLFLSDIPLGFNLRRQPVSRPAGGQPNPAHRRFYLDLSGNILGRKFYYHQRDYEEVLRTYRDERDMPEIEVQSIAAGRTLSGSLRFCNLTEGELAALVYALVLEDDLAHKIGYGKPLGLGSVQIHISKLQIERTEPDNFPARFWSYAESSLDEWTGRVSELRDIARAAWITRLGGRQSYDAFTAIARWPQVENFIYPHYTFFHDPSHQTLWEYQGRGPAEFHPSARRRERVRHRADVGLYVIDNHVQYVLRPEIVSAEILEALHAQIAVGSVPFVLFRSAKLNVGGTPGNVAVDVERV